jgi:ribosomal protein S18 acetylase RimI-like enzyme
MPTSAPPGKSPKGIQIHTCRTRSELRQFEDCGEDVLGSAPQFVPPIPGSVAGFFRGNSPFLRTTGELAAFIARRDGRPVGRIAAIRNRLHNEYHGDRAGFFGFFDFADDETADALFAAACAWLRERGLTCIRGPYSPSINDSCGLLSAGFDDPPTVFMPWNPARYVETYRQLGLSEVRRLYAFSMDMTAPADPVMVRLSERAREKSGLSTRLFDLRQPEKELRILQRLYNVTLDRNWGYVPVTWEELEHSAAGLRTIADSHLLYFVMHGGREVGYSISLPDINEFLLRSKSWPRGFLRLLPMLWMIKTGRPRRARHLIIGIEPEFRRRSGIAPYLYRETFRHVGAHYPVAEVSWVEANNEQIVRGIEILGGRRSKEYTIWEKPL